MPGYQAIVLAAGAGQRYGGGKLLADWRGEPLVRAAVRTALGAPVDEVLVVLGHQADEVASALSPLADRRLRLLTAAGWAEGLAASLRAGVGGLPAGSRGFLLFLADMPTIPAELPRQVVEGLEGGAAAVRPIYGETPAHPVGFSARFYEDLLRLKGDAGAGALLRGRADILRLETSDAGAIFDVDYPGATPPP